MRLHSRRARLQHLDLALSLLQLGRRLLEALGQRREGALVPVRALLGSLELLLCLLELLVDALHLLSHLRSHLFPYCLELELGELHRLVLAFRLLESLLLLLLDGAQLAGELGLARRRLRKQLLLLGHQLRAHQRGLLSLLGARRLDSLETLLRGLHVGIELCLQLERLGELRFVLLLLGHRGGRRRGGLRRHRLGHLELVLCHLELRRRLGLALDRHVELGLGLGKLLARALVRLATLLEAILRLAQALLHLLELPAQLLLAHPRLHELGSILGGGGNHRSSGRLEVDNNHASLLRPTLGKRLRVRLAKRRRHRARSCRPHRRRESRRDLIVAARVQGLYAAVARHHEDRRRHQSP